MEFKEIKPGMVIHCPTEEDARALLEHLEELGFLINEKDITHPEFEWSWNVPDGVCYMIDSENSWSWWRCEKLVEDDRLIYTEFSDLIEPDEPPMSAVEVLEWLDEYAIKEDVLEELFPHSPTATDIIANYLPETIVGKIMWYEAKKKAPEPVEVEWVDVARIIKIGDMGRSVCVCERDIVGATDDDLVKQGVEIALREYIAEHEGEYFAVYQKQCRVKEDES